MSPFEVRTLPIGPLVPADYNPRAPLSAAAEKKLTASLERFGLVEPLVWNESSGRLVGGHARLRLLRAAGVTEVPVSVVRLTDAEERALNVVLNNTDAQGRYDPAKLAFVLESLRDLPELAATGFDAHTLRALRYEPEPLAADATPEAVTVTLVIPAGVYAEASPALDEVVRRFGLEAHVRR